MSVEEILVFINKTLGEGSKIERQLLGGMMNISYIVSDPSGKEYVLYIPTKHANELVDRNLEKEHLDIVYQLGVTSKNVYFDTLSGIKINEFIPGVSLDHVEEVDYLKIAEVLKKIHNSIMLSNEDYHPFKRFIYLYEKEANEFDYEKPALYNEIRGFLFDNRYFLEGQNLALCHNDAQRSNFIKDENGDYHIIDFEFMGNNDPIYDIAAFGNGLVSEGRKLLDAYFNNNPSIDQIKRYYLWRIFISLQWYNVAISKHFNGEGKNVNFNFLDVANHFLDNAKTAYDGYKLEVPSKGINDDMEKLIVQTLDKIRHFLQKDGGDCEFVSFKDGIVYVKMHGACDGCAYAGSDIKELVEVILQEEVPGVLEVRIAE